MNDTMNLTQPIPATCSPVSHLSYSQITCYQQCPLKYQFQYVEKLTPAFMPSALAFGIAVHATLALLLHALVSGTPLEDKEVSALFEHEWEQACSGDIPVLFQERENFEGLLAKGQSLVAHFQAQYQPQIIVGIEEPFVVELGEDMPPFTGRIDLLEVDEEGTVCLIDFKTASRAPGPSAYAKDIQLTLYSLALQQLGWPEEESLLKYVYLVKTKTPQLSVVTTTCQTLERQWTSRLLKSIWDGIRKEVFYPNPSYLCKTCPFYEPCRTWQ